MDESVRRWRQSGRTYCWYEADKRQGDGWHIAADSAGCDDLDEIVNLAQSAWHPSRFSIELSVSPGQVAASAKRLELHHDQRWPADHWRLEQNADAVKLSFGSYRLVELRGAVADLRRGQGDYTIGGDDDAERLWVWWPPR